MVAVTKPVRTWKLAGFVLVRQLHCPLAGIHSCICGYHLLQHGLHDGDHHGCGGSVADPHGQESRDGHKAQHQPAEEGQRRKPESLVSYPPHPGAQRGAGATLPANSRPGVPTCGGSLSGSLLPLVFLPPFPPSSSWQLIFIVSLTGLRNA